MAKYTKEQAIKILTESAKAYQEKLLNRFFLIAFPEGNIVNYTVVVFRKQNFKHLTGVRTDITAKRFWEKCLGGKLSVNDFSFDSAGNTQLKLSVLPQLPQIFWNHAMRGEFGRTGICLNADYFVGTTKKLISVGFRFNVPADSPCSLYCEDVQKLTVNTTKVLGIWSRKDGERDWTCTYLAKDEDESCLREKLIDAGAPFEEPVGV